MRKLRFLFIAVFGLFFYSLLLAGSIRNIYLTGDEGKSRLGFMAEPLKFVAEIPSMIQQFLKRDEFYVPNDISEDGLVRFEEVQYSGSPKLLVTFKKDKFGQIFQLIDINSSTIIKEWAPENDDLYAKGYNEANPRKPLKGSDLYFMHPLMLPDSSLLITSQLTSLIARINSENELMWLKNDRIYHHSLEMDADGSVFACTQPFESNQYDILPGDYDMYKSRLLDDHITRIDPSDGSILSDKAVMEILLENGYEELLLYKGQVISDPIHLNDIQPALTDSEYWKRGDLLVSCRNISTVFLYRPSTEKILWLRHGPWYNQHDVDFVGGSQIMVFGNNVLREESQIDPRITSKNLAFSNKRTHNEVYLYDFETDSVKTPYHSLMESEEIRTITSGRCDLLPNGDLLVEETNNGRIVIGDSLHKKMEYVKRLDNEHVSNLFWCRLIN